MKSPRPALLRLIRRRGDLGREGHRHHADRLLRLERGLPPTGAVYGVSLAPHQIRVKAVLPGGIPTDQDQEFIQVSEIRAAFLQRTPLGRFGTPHDVAGAVKYFASDEARWITGSLLIMDGGYMLT